MANKGKLFTAEKYQQTHIGRMTYIRKSLVANRVWLIRVGVNDGWCLSTMCLNIFSCCAGSTVMENSNDSQWRCSADTDIRIHDMSCHKELLGRHMMGTKTF